MTSITAERNRELIHRVFETVINAHDPGRADGFYRADYIQHNADVAPGLAGMQQLLTMLLEAFPDLKAEISLSLAEADRVMLLVDWTGTHLGVFAGTPATMRAIRFRSAEIFRIENGLIAEHWDVVDSTAMQVALGLLALVRPAAGQ